MDHRHSGSTGGQLLISHVMTIPPTIHLYISHLHPQLALHRCGNDADAAIELLMMCPNGLLSTVNDADNDNDDTEEEEKAGANGEESRSEGNDAIGAVGVTVDTATTSSSSSSTTADVPSISAPSSSIREAKHSSLSKKEIRQVSDPLLCYPRMLTFIHLANFLTLWIGSK